MASVCKQIQTGQKVSVKDLEHGCEIALLPADQPGQTVIEVDPDYLVLDDAVAEVQIRIPTYLVKAVRDPSAPAPEVPVPEVTMPVVTMPEVTVPVVTMPEVAPPVVLPNAA